MTTLRLENYNVTAPGIDLSNYKVCQLLSPYVAGTLLAIESRDVLARTVVTEAHIRSYPDLEGVPPQFQAGVPDFAEKSLPKGLFAHLVDLSKSPHVPFPKPVLTYNASVKRTVG